MVSKWDGGVIPSTAVNADNTTKVQDFVAVAGQQVFTLTNFAYALGTNSLRVSLDGATQRIGSDVIEVDPVTFMFDVPLEDGDIVYAEGLVGSVATQSAEASAAAAAAYATAAESWYNAIIALSPPSLPLAIADGGTGQVTRVNAFDALAPAAAKGGLIVYNGADNVTLPVGANDSIIVADSTSATGLKYLPNKPVKTKVMLAGGALHASDGGSLVVVPVVLPTTTLTINIDASTSLYDGWMVWICNGNAGTGNSTGIITVNATGGDKFRDKDADTVHPSDFNIAPGEVLCLQSDGVHFITRVSHFGLSQGIKVQLTRASGVSLGVPVVGNNDRLFDAVSEDTTGIGASMLAAGKVTLSAGLWRYSMRSVHTGAAGTKLKLYATTGATLVATGVANPPNSLHNTMSGTILVTTPDQYYFTEYFSAAVGTLGTAVNDGNLEVYAEASFWREL